MEKAQSEAETAWTVELAKVRSDLEDSSKALADKDVALKDLSMQYALLSRTLYGVFSSSAVKEATLHWSMALGEDEVDGD